MTHDGFTNPPSPKADDQRGQRGLKRAREITRADMDRFAERSHQLAARATDEGTVADEIVSVTVKSRKSETTVDRRGDPPRHDPGSSSKLKAIGGDDATHTPGNAAPGVNDGAGAVVVASDEWAKQNGQERRHIADLRLSGRARESGDAGRVGKSRDDDLPGTTRRSPGRDHQPARLLEAARTAHRNGGIAPGFHTALGRPNRRRAVTAAAAAQAVTPRWPGRHPTATSPTTSPNWRTPANAAGRTLGEIGERPEDVDLARRSTRPSRPRSR